MSNCSVLIDMAVFENSAVRMTSKAGVINDEGCTLAGVKDLTITYASILHVVLSEYEPRKTISVRTSACSFFLTFEDERYIEHFYLTLSGKVCR